MNEANRGQRQGARGADLEDDNDAQGRSDTSALARGLIN